MFLSTRSIGLAFMVFAVGLSAGCDIIGTPDNENENGNMSMEFDGIAADTQTRLPFASQCAQFAGLCTSSFPEAVITITASEGQTVTPTDDPLGFIVEGAAEGIAEGTDGDGAESVQLRGSESELGNTAGTLQFSWSSGATDEDPCVRAPGEEFSTAADPMVNLQAGRHLIRLTVRNDLVLDPSTLPQQVIDECGDLGQDFKFSVLEILVEVRD